MANYNLVQAVFSREDFAPPEDTCVCTMHIRKVIANWPDIEGVDDAARDDFTQNWRDAWPLFGSHITDQLIFRELRYYAVPSSAGIDMGDPVQVDAINLRGGSAAAILPPQCAVSVTFKTQHRKRWGRFYLPGFTQTSLAGFGRIDTSVLNDCAAGGKKLADRGGTGAALVVFSRLHWNHEDVELVQVDDLWDVIRSRRFDLPLQKVTATPS